MAAYQIERSIEISVPSSKVFTVVSDFNTWSTWSPWLIAEPEATVRVTGTPGMVGSSYAWSGDVTGAGEMELRQAERNRRIEIELRFLRPFKTKAEVNFELDATTAGTRLVWRMKGRMPWFLFWMIPMMKTFIGLDYHRGLLMLKDWIEAGRIDSKVIPHGITPIGPLRMFGVRASAHVEKVGSTGRPAMERCQELFTRNGLSLTGETIAVYERMDRKDGTLEFIIGRIVSDSANLPAGGDLHEWRLPAIRAFRVEHQGAYHHLGNGWSVANQLTRHRKLQQSNAGTFEIHRDPLKYGPATGAKVDIFLPLKG